MTYLREAGAKAFIHSANADAVSYLTRGLEVVEVLPKNAEHDRQELALLLALGPVLQSTKGFATPEVEPLYTRARALAERVREPASAFQALWGLWMFSIGGAHLEPAHGIANELLAVAEHSRDPDLLLEAHHAMWASVVWLGDPLAAERHFEYGMTVYDRERHRPHALFYGGHDPGVCCLMHRGVALWILGHPVLAIESSERALVLGEQLAHAHSLALVLRLACALHHFRRDPLATARRAQQLIRVATEQDLPQWHAAGMIFDGWARGQQGEGEGDGDGIMQIRRGIDAYRATRTAIGMPLYLSILADAHLKAGQADEGLQAIEEGLAVTAETGERLWQSELHRLRGDLLLLRSSGDDAEAQESLRTALDIARRQGARSWELRAARSLGRLLGQQGKRDEARQTLAAVYNWFSEGLDTADLREAKTTLEALS